MSNFLILLPGMLKISALVVVRYLVREQMCLLLSSGWKFGKTSGIRVVPTTISNPILAWALQETKNWSSFLKISTFFLHSLPLFPFPLCFAVLNLWCGHCQRGAPPPTHPGAPLCQSPLPKFLNSNAQSKWERGRECRKVWWFFLPT